MSVSLATPWTVACHTSLFMGFPGKNTGVNCLFLLQGIFLTQGSNLRLLLRSRFFFFFFKSPNHRRHNSEDLGKKSVSQYPFHPCASNVCLSIILALPADLHQYFFLCVYYLKPGHFSSCCWFTYYCCFLETVFLFSGLKFRYLFPRH